MVGPHHVGIGAYSKDFMLAYRTISMRPEGKEFYQCTLGYKASKMIGAGAAAKPLIDVYDMSARRLMDELLLDCFLQAAKTDQITKQLRLGMPCKGSRIYAECIRPCRPLGTSIDVKASSFACLKGFFEDLEAKGLLELKYSAPDPVVARFFWKHPGILNFRPWPLATTVLGASEEPTQSMKSTPQRGVRRYGNDPSLPISKNIDAASIVLLPSGLDDGAEGHLENVEIAARTEAAFCAKDLTAEMTCFLPSGLLDDPPGPEEAVSLRSQPSSIFMDFSSLKHGNGVPDGLHADIIRRIPSPNKAQRYYRY